MPAEEVLLWENPDMLDNPWYENPRRRRKSHRRRNPAGALALPKGLADFTQGVGPEEIIGGGAGLMAAAATPRMIVAPAKNETGEELTTNEKLIRILVGVGATFGVGFLAQNFAGKRAAKAAVIGGLAGTAVTVINTFTPMKLGTPVNSSSIRRLTGPIGRTMGSSGRVSTQTPGFEDIKMY